MSNLGQAHSRSLFESTLDLLVQLFFLLRHDGGSSFIHLNDISNDHHETKNATSDLTVVISSQIIHLSSLNQDGQHHPSTRRMGLLWFNLNEFIFAIIPQPIA